MRVAGGQGVYGVALHPPTSIAAFPAYRDMGDVADLQVEVANEKEASSRREAEELRDRLRRSEAEAAETSEQLRRALTDSSTRLAETERTLYFRVADAESKLETARRELRDERDAVAQLQASLQETEQARVRGTTPGQHPSAHSQRTGWPLHAEGRGFGRHQWRRAPSCRSSKDARRP